MTWWIDKKSSAQTNTDYSISIHLRIVSMTLLPFRDLNLVKAYVTLIAYLLMDYIHSAQHVGSGNDKDKPKQEAYDNKIFVDKHTKLLRDICILIVNRYSSIYMYFVHL